MTDTQTPGWSRGSCRLGDGKPAKARGLCGGHYQRELLYGDPLTPDQRTGRQAEAHPSWKGRTITYQAAHNRVRSRWGSASLWDCVACGLPADDWAYDEKDPEELRGPGGAYFPDPAHYRPLCRMCHCGRSPGLRQVESLRAQGWGMARIAAHFGVSRTIISTVLRAKRQADYAASLGRKFPG
jgi:hypothetical protein